MISGWKLFFICCLILGCARENNDAPKELTSAEHLKRAITIFENKPLVPANFPVIDAHLKAIKPTDPEYKEAVALGKKVAIERAAVAISSRQNYVNELERVYLKNGYDVHLSATGPEKTTFTFKYVLVSRPLVYQLSESESFIAGLRQRGFKKVVFTDGYDQGWTLDIK